MKPGGIVWRISHWLSRGENAFNVALFFIVPPMVVIIGIGFF